MNYNQLVRAIENGEDEVATYLEEDVLLPCLEGHDNCDWEIRIDEKIRADEDSIKDQLVTVTGLAVLQQNENTYEVHIRAVYQDTFASVVAGRFLKCVISIAIEGHIDPNASAYDGIIYVKPTEVV